MSEERCFSWNEERCIFCGEVIPEGGQVCPACYERVLTTLPEGWLTRDLPRCPIRESMIIGYRYKCPRCEKEVRFDIDRYCPNCGQRLNWYNWKERRN